MKKETIKTGQIEVNFFLEGNDSNGQIAMFDFMVPVGAKVPLPHSHEHYDETIYGLEGVITFTVNGKPVDIPPGGTCFIPRGSVHGFDNPGQQNAKALAIVTPALIGPDYFKDIAEVLNAGGPPDIEKIKTVMLKHGLVPAIPKN